MRAAMHINRLLKPLRVELRRIPRPMSKEVTPTAGHIVEMIGPSGVGKSTLYRQLPAEIRDAWYSRSHISSLLRRRGAFFADLAADDGLIETLLRKKFEKLFSNAEPLQYKYRLYDYFAGELAADAFVRKQCLMHRGFLSEEGVTHNFTSELLAWHDNRASHNPEDMRRIRDFMRGRSIILVDAPLAHIMRNLHRRHAEFPGSGNDWLAHRDEQEVAARTQKSQCIKHRWLAIASELGSATLTLNASESLETNRQKITEFLESILSRQGSDRI